MFRKRCRIDWRRSGRSWPRSTPFWLHEQKYKHARDQDDKQEDDPSLGGAPLMTGSHGEFFVGGLDFDRHFLDVVVYAIEHRSLIDHHRVEVLEDVCQLDDTLRNVLDLALALRNHGLVGTFDQPLLRRLRKRRLRERPVCFRLEKGGIGVGGLYRRGRSRDGCG